MAPDRVTTETRGRVRVVRLNRPDKLNAADPAMQRGLLETLRAILADGSAAAAVLTGAGTAFCAGGDLAVVRELAAGNDRLADELATINEDLLTLMLRRELPVVAAVNGPAIGFGAALLAMCDIVVMAASAYVSEPHARYGLAPSPALRLVWPELTSRLVAKELLLTGRRVGAEEAVRIGLANRAVPDGAELATAVQIATDLATVPRAGILAVLQQLNGPLGDRAAGSAP
ncbi:enoyl-CoA hydratase/isomerase family protein [Pseudofrankia inefficax]|uniref:Enoyl-CoA hydratase/isomerase n=1 Tax=Pseudofrankia inefficax (strain DSM 45817 / CECT 9037 / DDB 130130 / EuI1c) TaxID=298654 RepID=E3J2Q6_PSEI1|nr:enoyl-CoA hydratase/isomerase family protein [Pseudofrankia inefficax]ADP81717.1 Enoyl-CoA hydratase/isomerase [Pseudofrankia inefficax]